MTKFVMRAVAAVMLLGGVLSGQASAQMNMFTGVNVPSVAGGGTNRIYGANGQFVSNPFAAAKVKVELGYYTLVNGQQVWNLKASKTTTTFGANGAWQISINANRAPGNYKMRFYGYKFTAGGAIEGNPSFQATEVPAP